MHMPLCSWADTPSISIPKVWTVIFWDLWTIIGIVRKQKLFSKIPTNVINARSYSTPEAKWKACFTGCVLCVCVSAPGTEVQNTVSCWRNGQRLGVPVFMNKPVCVSVSATRQPFRPIFTRGYPSSEWLLRYLSNSRRLRNNVRSKGQRVHHTLPQIPATDGYTSKTSADKQLPISASAGEKNKDPGPGWFKCT